MYKKLTRKALESSLKIVWNFAIYFTKFQPKVQQKFLLKLTFASEEASLPPFYLSHEASLPIAYCSEASLPTTYQSARTYNATNHQRSNIVQTSVRGRSTDCQKRTTGVSTESLQLEDVSIDCLPERKYVRSYWPSEAEQGTSIR